MTDPERPPRSSFRFPWFTPATGAPDVSPWRRPTMDGAGRSSMPPPPTTAGTTQDSTASRGQPAGDGAGDPAHPAAVHPGRADAGYRTFFDDGFLRRLDRLQLVSQRMHGAASHGGRRSKKRGTSVEFADYREYSYGDDLRQIDWNIYGRSERLYVKLREDEESLTVHLLVDCSRSMDFGRHNKLDYARRLAAALGYVALAGQDRVEAAAFGARLLNRLPPLQARGQTGRLFTFLADLRPAGATDLKAVLRAYAAQHRRSGMAIMISDLLNPGGLDGLAALLDRGYEAVLLHLLDPLETDPEADGEVELHDREDGARMRISLDATVVDAYRQRLNTWIAETEAFCARRQVRYLTVSTAMPIDELVFQQLRARRILT